MHTLAVIDLPGGVLTVAIAAVGSFIGVKAALATHAANIKANSDKLAEGKLDAKDLEKRVRDIEIEDGKTEAYMNGFLKSLKALGDKIDEWNK